MTVYFIGQKGVKNSLIKIGVTCDLVDRRVASLQTGNHEELEVVATIDGGKETEAYLHESLSAYRIRGECFERSQEVDEAIERAIAIGAAALPLDDPGVDGAPLEPTADAAMAKSICRKITSRVLDGYPMEPKVSWLFNRLRKACPLLTRARIRSLYMGEARRVDYYEMAALIALRDRFDRHCEDRSDLVCIPIITRCLSDVGEPLSAEQQQKVDAHVLECVERLRQDRDEWGFSRLSDFQGWNSPERPRSQIVGKG